MENSEPFEEVTDDEYEDEDLDDLEFPGDIESDEVIK